MKTILDFCLCMIVGLAVAVLFGLLEAVVMAALDAD